MISDKRLDLLKRGRNLAALLRLDLEFDRADIVKELVTELEKQNEE